VVAAFDRSFYARLDTGWICVGRNEIGSGPLNILCDYRWLRPTVDDGVRVVKSELSIAGKLFARLASVPLWAPNSVPSWTVSRLRRGLRAVDDFWRGELTNGGLAAAGCESLPERSSPLFEAARPGLAILKRSIEGGAIDCVGSSRLSSLIGLGPGLTPSGDDLVGGALIALAALGRTDRRDLLWGDCLPWLARTNDISQMHLQAAALGFGAAGLHAAIHATMSGDVARLGPALAGLTGIGHTSGLDAFAGSLIVLRHAIGGAG
jgi:hypothetical protein